MIFNFLASFRSFQFPISTRFFKRLRKGKSRDEFSTPLEKSINLTIYGWKENKPERKERGICLTASTVGEGGKNVSPISKFESSQPRSEKNMFTDS